MTDLYSELLIKKEQTGKDKAIKILMIAAIAITAAAGLLIPIAWILTLALGIAAYFILPKLDLEYEYVFVNGDLDIDKIMNKARRKRMFSVDADQMELLAPVGAVELMQYKKVRTYDYTSGKNHAEIYALIASNKGELCKVLFEPNETIIEGFFVKAPRKVIRK